MRYILLYIIYIFLNIFYWKYILSFILLFIILLLYCYPNKITEAKRNQAVYSMSYSCQEVETEFKHRHLAPEPGSGKTR